MRVEATSGFNKKIYGVFFTKTLQLRVIVFLASMV